MAVMSLRDDDLPSLGGESSIKRTARIRREADGIRRGEDDIAAGRGIDDSALEAWLAALEADADAPLPPTDGGSASRS